MNVEQQYIDLFSQTEAMICKHSAEVLNAPRAAAFADFERLGFPTRKMEKYKYTDISKYFEPDYGLNLNRLQIPVNPYEVFKCDVPNMSTALYFVVNDAFYNKALPKTHLPEGVIFGSLKEVAAEHPELVKKYYGKLADTSKDGITAFNTAFAQDGVIFYVPKNVIVEKPIQLVNILRADVNFMVNRRVLIILEDGAQARLLICDHAMDNVNFLATQVIEAGVDIDMDIGYKDISRLDSEEQFMGRINRSGKKEGVVYFFNMDDASVIYKNDVRIEKDKTLENEEIRQLLLLKNFPEFYETRILPSIKKEGEKINDKNLEEFFCDKVALLNMPEVAKPKEEPAKPANTREASSQTAVTGLEGISKIQSVTPEMLAEERKEVEHLEDVHTHHEEKVYAEKNIYDNGTFQREYYQLYYQ